MRTRVSGAVLGVLAVAVLTGCTGGAEPSADQPVPSASASVTPTAEPVLTSSSAPRTDGAVSAFSGDCAALLTDAELDDILGRGSQPIIPADTTEQAIFDAALSASGGVRCAWDAGAAGELTAAILPAAIVAEETVESTSMMACAVIEGNSECSVAIAAPPTWLRVHAQGEAAAEQALAAISSGVVDQRPVAAPFPADAWAIPVCTDVALTVAQATGWTDATAGAPLDAHASELIRDVLAEHGTIRHCDVSSATAGMHMRVDIVPGFARDAVLSRDLAPVAVSGSDAAFLDSGRVYALQGSNLLSASSAPGMDGTAALEALLPLMVQRPLLAAP